jgi:hypothetical protein
VGGIWGLFAGFSILTFIEWVELYFNFLYLFSRRVHDVVVASDKTLYGKNSPVGNNA